MMGRVSQRYSWRLDYKQTAANADRELKKYRHRHQKSLRRDVLGVQSPGMDGMPRNDSIDNGQENKLVQFLSDGEFVQKVRNAIGLIEDDQQRELLDLLYIKHPLTVEAIMERMHISNTAYYNLKQSALCSFAEVWPPAPSELLAYRMQSVSSE